MHITQYTDSGTAEKEKKLQHSSASRLTSLFLCCCRFSPFVDIDDCRFDFRYRFNELVLCALCYAYECMNVLNKSTFFLCVFNLRPRIDLCVFLPSPPHFILKAFVCLVCSRQEKLILKEKNLFFLTFFLPSFFPSRPSQLNILVCDFPTEYLGYNQGR